MVLSLSQSVTPVLKKVIVAAALCGGGSNLRCPPGDGSACPAFAPGRLFRCYNIGKGGPLTHRSNGIARPKPSNGPDASTYASMSLPRADMGGPSSETRSSKHVPLDFPFTAFLACSWCRTWRASPFELSIEPKDPVEPGQTVDKVKARFAEDGPGGRRLNLATVHGGRLNCHSPD